MFRCACTDQVTATVATIGSQVNDIVSRFDDLHVVFDDQNGVSSADEGIEGVQEFLDVMEVETGCRFIKDEERGFLLLLSDEIRQFDTLVLTTGERGGVLAQFDVAEAYVFEGFEATDDLWVGWV